MLGTRAASLFPTAALLVVTAVWGSTFFMIKGLVTTIPSLDFLGIRFAIAAAVVILWRWKDLLGVSGKTWRRRIILALIFSAGQILQTIGLETTAASISGFLTGLYVVFTPLLAAVLLREQLGRRVWIAEAMASAGLAFLSLQGLTFSAGAGVTVLAAVLYAFHVLFLSQWAPDENPATLAFIQVVAAGALLGMAALPSGVVLPRTPAAWGAILCMALIAGLLVVFLQTWAQARLTAPTAAVIMTTEPVFATMFAIMFGGESLTLRIAGGGALVLAAMFVVEGGTSPDGASKKETRARAQ